MRDAKSVYAIVLNTNDRVNVIECIDSIAHLDDRDVKTVVVDNASSDGSREALRARIPAITLIENERNFGYAAGNNVGMRYALAAGAGYVWVLNSDIITMKGSLRRLIEAAERDPGLGIVGPVIYHYPETGKFWNSGYRFDRKSGRLLPVLRPEVDEAGDGSVIAVDVAQGCSMLIRREVLEKAGLFDERFFIYYEEADLCIRAAESGFRVGTVCGSQVFHKGFTSVGGKVSPLCLYLRTRNGFLFIRKHSHGFQRARFMITYIIESVLAQWWLQIRNFIVLKDRFSLARAGAIAVGCAHSLVRHYGKGPYAK